MVETLERSRRGIGKTNPFTKTPVEVVKAKMTEGEKKAGVEMDSRDPGPGAGWALTLSKGRWLLLSRQGNHSITTDQEPEPGACRREMEHSRSEHQQANRQASCWKVHNLPCAGPRDSATLLSWDEQNQSETG